MFEILIDTNNAINDFVWGIPVLALLIGTGVLMTILTGAFQFRHFGHMWSNTIGGLFKKKDSRKSSDAKSISQFQALCTALSSTIGTGNISGVAYAITMGGPGAVFWMWVASLLGMATHFSENILAIYFRKRNANGEWAGGPMYYLKYGLGSKKGMKIIGEVLAFMFAIFVTIASFGTGNLSQINSIKESILTVGSFTGNQTTDALIIGIVLAVVAALVILGGLKRIATTNEKLVPFMSAFFIIGSLIIIFTHLDQLGPAFAAIFKGAFNMKAVAGGAAGSALKLAITWGFKRGVFSNEAGLGSSCMVASTADVKEPVHQGLWGMFEVFFDTIVICTMTALTILMSGVVDINTGVSISGATKLGLATEAFNKCLGPVGGIFMAIAVTLFAFSTTLGWSYYGTTTWEYMFGKKSSIIYKILYIICIIVATVTNADMAISVSDTMNGLMIIPNLIGVLSLCGTTLAIVKNYKERTFKGNTDIKPMLSFYEDHPESEK